MKRGSDSPILDGDIVLDYGFSNEYGDHILYENNCDWALSFFNEGICGVSEFSTTKLFLGRILNVN